MLLLEALRVSKRRRKFARTRLSSIASGFPTKNSLRILRIKNSEIPVSGVHFFLLRIKADSSRVYSEQDTHVANVEGHQPPLYSRGAEGFGEFATFTSRNHLWAESPGA